ncbi:hypothetical protein ACF8FF_07190 [Pseudomonas sp. zjy_13]|uniref:hypothetical protein n=1 Tax=Pseudomonas sp. zjy_13 TaxID=3367263 RepID=UPI00370A8567
MKQLTRNVLYIALTALLGLILAFLMFDIKPNASSVSGVVVGAVVTRLASLLYQNRRAAH